MGKLITNNLSEFEIEFGGPVSITENIVFLARIKNSDVDAVHNTFKIPENTERLVLQLNEGDPGTEYFGYTRYCGFDVDNDGAITLTLKKQV